MNWTLCGMNLVLKEELYGLRISPNNLEINISRMERTGHLACVWERRIQKLLKSLLYEISKKWKEDEEEGVRSYWMTLRQERILSIEGGSSRSHCVDESFWKRLWTCRLTDYWWWWWDLVGNNNNSIANCIFYWRSRAIACSPDTTSA
jgi:hypothetical protein